MKPSTVALLLVCVLCAGCSQLASPVNEPTTPTIEPEDATAPPQTSETRTQSATRTQAVTTTATQTATLTATPTTTATPTATPTRTPIRPPTATATPIRTTAPIRTASPTPESASLTIVAIDAPDETVTFRNTGGRPLDLGGYVVDFDDGQRYTFPRYVLAPGETVTLHTGRGDSAGSEFYAGFFFPVLNAQGDTLLVENPSGEIILARRVPATPRDSTT